MMQEKIRTIHVYLEEEEVQPIIEADPEPEPEQTRYRTLGIFCIVLLFLFCLGVPLSALLLASSAASGYDTMLSQNLTLTLSLHPTGNQLQLTALSPIIKTEQVTINATGTIHQNATKATGLITFYNGLFTPQTVQSGTTLTGKDGITVTTSQDAVIPAATATTPPTYGTISVTAYSVIAGTVGNIAANDIDTACCGSSILVQNLYAFSGGLDEKDVPVLTKTDISNGTQALISQVSTAIDNQAQAETKPGSLLLPLNCPPTITMNHQPGEQEATAILSLKQSCTPLAYAAADITTISKHFFTLPHGYHLVSFTALVLASNTTPTGGELTVHAIAYLKHDTPTIPAYRFTGK